MLFVMIATIVGGLRGISKLQKVANKVVGGGGCTRSWALQQQQQREHVSLRRRLQPEDLCALSTHGNYNNLGSTLIKTFAQPERCESGTLLCNTL